MGFLQRLREFGKNDPDMVGGRSSEYTPISEGIMDLGNFNDPDSNLTASQGGSAFFRRITASRRDLHPIIQDRMHEIAYFLYDSQPLAKRVIELTRDFVVGDGITVVCSDPDEKRREEIQREIDLFWNDSINNMPLKQFMKVAELGIYGELCISVTPNPKTGRVRLGYIDPSDIALVVTADGNAEIQKSVILRGADSNQTTRLKIVHLDEDADSESYGRMVGVERDDSGKVTEKWEDKDEKGKVTLSGLYVGSCFLFQINKVTNAHRGRSDLLTLADWLDAYDQMLFNTIDRSMMMKNFIWDVSLKGANDATIDKYSKANPSPKPGAVRYHNDTVTWTAVSPDLNSTDDMNNSDLIVSLIATGAGLAKTWINGTMDVNRATASELGEPALARLSTRQTYVKYMFRSMVEYNLDCVEMTGRIKKREPIKGEQIPDAWPLGLTAPDLRAKDTGAASQALASAVNALVAAHTAFAVDEETMQQTVAHLLKGLGIEVDVDEMRTRLEKEKKEAKLYQQQQMDAQQQQGQDDGSGQFGGQGGGQGGQNGRPGQNNYDQVSGYPEYSRLSASQKSDIRQSAVRLEAVK